jgi:tetratricopeptide (TPR) repeat protein
VWGKLVIGYLTLVCLAGLVLTGSRGGYLSTTAGMVVFALLSVWTARASLSEATGRRIVGIIIAVVLVGGALAFVTNRSFAVRQRANSVFVSEDIRLSLWDAALKQFQVAPAFGTGSRTYTYYGRMFRKPHLQGDPVFAHNDFLQLLAEYGIAGVLLLVGFVLAHLRHARRTWLDLVHQFSPALSSATEKNSLALQIGSMSAVVACLVHAAMDFNLHIPANLLLTAWLFGNLATTQAEPIEIQSGWRHRIPYAIPAALGLWMILVAAPKLPGELLVETARGKFVAGQAGPAVEDAARAFALGARNPELLFQLGEAQRIMSQHHRSAAARAGAIEEALDAYTEAVAIFPKDVKLVRHAAWALDRLGRFDEAEKLFAQARELDPNSATVWAFSALHWHLQNKPAEALADYRMALQLGGGLVPVVLAELDEKLDPQELEKAASK